MPLASVLTRLGILSVVRVAFGHNVIPHVPTNLVLQYQRILSPTTINEVKFGLNRAKYHNWGYGTSPIAVSIPSFDSVSDTSLDTEVGTSFSYIDNLTLVRGRHNLKFGAEVRRIRLNNSGNTLTTSSITYATNDDFINDRADSATYLQGEGVVQIEIPVGSEPYVGRQVEVVVARAGHSLLKLHDHLALRVHLVDHLAGGVDHLDVAIRVLAHRVRAAGITSRRPIDGPSSGTGLRCDSQGQWLPLSLR